MATLETDRWIERTLGLTVASAKRGAPPKQGTVKAGALAALPGLWAAAERAVQEEVAALRADFLAEYGDDPAAGDAEAGFEAHVQQLMGVFDQKIAGALAKASATADVATGAKIARLVIGQCEKRVAGDKTIALFDSNPFVHVDIAGSLTRALAAMSAALD